MASTRKARRRPGADAPGLPEPPPEGLIGGSADYSIGELVGVGLVGPVRRGRYLPTGAQVDLELIPDHLSTQPEFVARLIDSGRAASHLRDPRIVAVYDVIHDAGGSLFVISEPFDQPSFEARAPEGSGLPRDETVEVATGLLAALDVLHRAGVAHGALTRRTILRSARGAIRLTGIPVGSAVRRWGAADAARPSIASDISEVSDLITDLLREPLPGRTAPRPLPRWLAPVLRAAKRPRRGFASAGEMLAAVEAAKAEARPADRVRPAPLAGLPAPPPAVESMRTRWRSRVAMGAAAVAAGIALGLTLNATLLPHSVSGGLQVRSLSLAVATTPACGANVQLTARGSVDGQGMLVYRWGVDGAGGGDHALAIHPGAGGFAVSQSLHTAASSTPESVSFQILRPSQVAITRAVTPRCG